MGLLVLTQMHCAHLRKRKPIFHAGRTFIRDGRPVHICVRTKNYIAEYECAFCQSYAMEDNGIMRDFATGTGQQEGSADHHPQAGVREREELSEDVKKEQR